MLLVSNRSKKRSSGAGRVAYTVATLALLAAGFLLTFHPSRPLFIRYRELPVIVGADGIRLAGTLSLPRWRRPPYPGAVIVHGSGRGVRADMITDVRRLIERGFAVYTYDKRGVGESTGTYEEPSSGRPNVLHDLARHARAAYDKLCQQPEVDPARVGFFGVSQAGWIIPLAASEPSGSPPPSYAVILSGPAVSIGVEELYSRLTGDGRNPSAMQDLPRIRAEVDSAQVLSGYDPQSVLERFRVPSLWILGETDLSVPTWASVRVLHSLREQHGVPISLITYPEAGHDLRRADGQPNPQIWIDIDAFLRQTQIYEPVPVAK
jgi:alpha-beta hydrolase superfamily lysophospholipase